MASATGKRRTDGTTPDSSETKFRASRSLSADTKPKIKSKSPEVQLTLGLKHKEKKLGFLIQFFSELDDFQDIL